jgi:hypothetical protein
MWHLISGAAAAHAYNGRAVMEFFDRYGADAHLIVVFQTHANTDDGHLITQGSAGNNLGASSIPSARMLVFSFCHTADDL